MGDELNRVLAACMGSSSTPTVPRAGSRSPRRLFRGKKNDFALLLLESGCLAGGQGRKGVAALYCPPIARISDTPRYPSAEQIPVSCPVLAPSVVGNAEHFPTEHPSNPLPPIAAEVITCSQHFPKRMSSMLILILRIFLVYPFS